MNNALLTPNIYAKFVCMNLGRNLNVCRNMCKDVTPEFMNKKNPVGASVNVRKPYRFIVTDGLGYQPQPLADVATPVTVNQVSGVHYDWNSIEKTLQLRQGAQMNDAQLKALNDLYAGPAALALASVINSRAATFIAQQTANSVGTLGTAPTTQATYLAAGDLLVAQGLPNEEQKNLVLIVNRRMSSAFIGGTVAYFNPQTAISEQLENGEIVKRLMGYRIEQDQTINRHANGAFTGTTPLCNAAVAQTADGGNNATMSLVTDGWTSSADTLTKGTKFTIGSATSATIGGVNSVHPQTKVDTGYQQVFTVLDTITSTGVNMTVNIYPAITPYGQYQNTTTGAVNNAIITIVGTTSLTGDQGILMHPNAFAFVSVPMIDPEPGMGAICNQVTDPDTGIALSIIKAFDSRTREEINRIDCLYDFSRLYGEMACVIQA